MRELCTELPLLFVRSRCLAYRSFHLGPFACIHLISRDFQSTSWARSARSGILSLGTLSPVPSRPFSVLRQRLISAHFISSGANFIHGHSETNPITKLIHETQTTLHTWGESQSAFSPAGEPMPADLVATASEKFWSMIADAFQHSNEHSERIPAERSLMDFIKENIDKEYPPSNAAKAQQNNTTSTNARPAAEERADVERKLLFSEAEAWGGFVGGATDRQSLKFFWLEECIEGENPFVADTYAKILERIAAPALKGARLLFDHCVSSISTEHVADGGVGRVRAETGGGNGGPGNAGVLVEAGNQSFVESFDEVIVTLPLCYLKKHKQSIFKPGLRPRLEQSIDAVGYGSLDKVRPPNPRGPSGEKREPFPRLTR